MIASTFYLNSGCQMKMTFFHAQLQLDSASVQAKRIYIILRHLQYSGITVPGVKIPQIYYIIAITVK